MYCSFGKYDWSCSTEEEGETKSPSQEKNWRKFVLLKRMTPLWTERVGSLEWNENWVANFLVSYCLLFPLISFPSYSEATLAAWGSNKPSSIRLTPTFLCPFPWQLFLCCWIPNRLIGEPKETAALIGRFRVGQERETAVECLPLSFITTLLFLLLLLRWVEV